MRSVRWRWAIVLCFVAQLVPLTTARADAVDEYVQAEMTKRRIPGLALVVVQNGKVFTARGYGLANVELDVPVTPDTVFELASVTKQFTATGIMSMVEEGKLGLDDPIARYLGEVPETWQAMTVRHLLTHTAGLPDLDNGFKSLWVGGARAGYSTTQMFNAAKKDPLGFRPGERWQYSDVGYFLLGMILEKVSGQRYRDFVKQRFFEPLGMTSSSVVDQWAIVKNRAAGYTLRNGQLAHIRRFVQIELPSHYGILSSVNDMAKWELALSTGKVVRPSSLDEMWTPVTLNDGTPRRYGFGWGIEDRRGHRVITHNGITGTEYSRFPDDGLTVIMLTNLGRNLGTMGVNPWGITFGVAGRYIPGLLVSSLAPQADANPARSAQLRAFLTAVAAGEADALMTDGLRKLITASTRKIIGERVRTLTDFTFIACDDVNARSADRFGSRSALACHYRMQTGPETRYYTFWLTPDGRVADFNSSLE